MGEAKKKRQELLAGVSVPIGSNTFTPEKDCHATKASLGDSEFYHLKEPVLCKAGVAYRATLYSDHTMTLQELPINHRMGTRHGD